MFQESLPTAVKILTFPTGVSERARMPRPNANLTALERFGSLYGSSEPMQSLYKMIGKVAPTDATVLVVGESGSGKELVARSIHQMSGRSKDPFVAVNCGAIPANLIEAELFGYEKGAFTGAAKTHRGYFERASGGTLFLDEITEMAPEMQVRLLRVLESGRFYRVGGDHEIRADVRIIAATNRQPWLAVKQNHLREDLLYRLAIFPIMLPPLRDRGADVELLARHFVDDLNDTMGGEKSLSAASVALLYSHSWPGNVRELKNCVQRGFILAQDIIELECMDLVRSTPSDIAGNCLQFNVGTPLAEMEKQTIFATLEHCRGNKKRAAEILGVSLKTLYNRLTEYNATDDDAQGVSGEAVAG
ncbi:MAG: sigma-54 dependent transcriptional regulator [Betaproteobacteria bacterium]